MTVKNFDFLQIKYKAEQLRRINVGESLEEFLTRNKDAYRVLEEEPFAPLIGTICDERIKADDAWSIPYFLRNEIGSLDPKEILKFGEFRLKQFLRETLEGKWPTKMNESMKIEWLDKISRAIISALKMFLERNNTPINMFENREYSVLEVYFMLRRIPGIGSKKANMITRDFAYRSLGITKKHPWFDQIKRIRPNFYVVNENLLDMPIDVNVVKVFSRIFGQMRGNWRKLLPAYILDIISFSKLAFPEFPAKLDEIFWIIGREYCSDNNPRCMECPIVHICETGRLSMRRY
ncbi:MAG: hypothetical protein ACTSXX_08975 [Candidatus Baldrarchaeia archaeon]